MLKRILFIVLLLGFLGGLGYSYLFFKNKKQPISNTLNAIPSSAAFIIESNNSINFWKKLSETNIIWAELQTTKDFSEIDAAFRLIDSLRGNSEFNQLINKQSIFISAHMSGANTFDYLFSCAIPNTISAESVFDFITTKLNLKNLTSKQYDNVIIMNADINSKKINYALHQGILVMSKSSILIEDAIRQINSGTSLLEINDFKKVVHTAGKSLDANFYVNYKVLPNILKTFFRNENIDAVESFSDLANWTEMDLSLKPNSVSLNGYTYSNDSVNNYMNVFIDQKPQKLDVLEIIPTNTSFMVRIGVSDFGKFQQRYKTYLEKNNKLFEFGAKLKLLEASYSFSAQDDIYAWIDNEIALFVTEMKINNDEQQCFAVFKSNNVEKTKSKLDELTQQVNIKNDTELDSTNYEDIVIKKIDIPSFLPVLFNSLFNPITGNYYAIIEDYVVFGNTITGLKEIISSYKHEKTLKKDPDFNNFYSIIETESNLFVYSNISKSTLLFKSLLNEEYGNYVNEYEELFQKFDGFAIQVSADKNNMYYNNVFLHYNPEYKQETKSLWEIQLDTTVSLKPQLLINHLSSAKDIFIQDDANNIYLISNTGNILWEKKLDGKILGEVNQIDLYKNRKLQLLFNTEDRLYLLDRNGKNVENYPVKFKHTATSPATVLDYDNNKHYRILIAFEDKSILNFEGNGNKVKGWEFERSKAIISTQFKHNQINRKDYIVNVDVEGNVYILDRKGEYRTELKNKLSGTSIFDLEMKKEINKSYVVNIDSVGNIYKLYFDDLSETTKINDVNPSGYMDYKDLNKDKNKDYLFISEKSMVGFSKDFEKILELNFDNKLKYKPQIFELENDELWFGATLKNNEISVLNQSGTPLNGFPLFGSTQFAIDDINNDDTFELVVGGNDGRIYTYTLEKHNRE